MSETEYDRASFVIASKYREVVIDELSTGAATPSAIAERNGQGIAHISRALQELRDEGVVELLVSEDRTKGRIYGLTDEGDEITDLVADLGGART